MNFSKHFATGSRLGLVYGAFAIMLWAIPDMARAQAERRFSYSATAATDYVSRGVSRSDGRGSAAIGVDLRWNDLYAGTWLSSVGGLEGADAEILTYGGWRTDRWGYSFDLRAIGRLYPGIDAHAREGYIEGQASVSQTIGPIRYGARLAYTPNAERVAGMATPTPSEHGDGFYGELNGAYALTRRAQLSAEIGRQVVGYVALDTAGRRRSASYDTWNVGLAYDLNDHLAFDIRYWDTDAHRFDSDYGSRLVGSLTATF